MIRTLALLALFPLLVAADAGREEEFWAWFGQNEAALFALDIDDPAQRGQMFPVVAQQLRRVHRELVFELEPVENGRRELVISADGEKAAFPAVEALVAKAPTLERWRFTAFRPRRSPINALRIDGVLFDPKDVWVKLAKAKDGAKVDLVLFLRGYQESEKTIYGQAAFHFLDRALGERDVVAKVGYVDLAPLGPEPPKDGVPLAQLARAFDALLAAPPPIPSSPGPFSQPPSRPPGEGGRVHSGFPFLLPPLPGGCCGVGWEKRAGEVRVYPPSSRVNSTLTSLGLALTPV